MKNSIETPEVKTLESLKSQFITVLFPAKEKSKIEKKNNKLQIAEFKKDVIVLSQKIPNTKF